MRVALPVWQGRIAPLLDVARWLLVVDVIGGEPTFTKRHPLGGPDREGIVSELGVDVLICGAVSQELEEKLVALGIEVLAEVRGRIDDVLKAHAEGRIVQPCFLMPGHHCRRRRARPARYGLEAVDASDRRAAERRRGDWLNDDEPDGWAVH